MAYTENIDFANARIAQLEQERYLIDRGCPAEDADFYSFKIAGMVSDEKTFEAAADEYIKNAGFRNHQMEPAASVVVDMSGSLNSRAPAKPVDMNTWIRDSIKNKGN